MKNKGFCKKLLCMLLFFAVLLSAAEGAVASAAEGSCELPVVRIDSAVGAEGSNSYEAVTVSIDNAPAQFRLEPSEAVWKLHGRSSARSEKKSFNLKFPGRVDLFGMGAAKKWVLVANSYDRTMLRNKLMYDLSGEIGMRCPMESCFVELYINGEYRGVYQLCEAPEIDKERVAIHPAREEFLLEYLLAWREASDPVITTPVYQLQFMLNSLDYLPPPNTSISTPWSTATFSMSSARTRTLPSAPLVLFWKAESSMRVPRGISIWPAATTLITAIRSTWSTARARL